MDAVDPNELADIASQFLEEEQIEKEAQANEKEKSNQSPLTKEKKKKDKSTTKKSITKSGKNKNKKKKEKELNEIKEENLNYENKDNENPNEEENKNEEKKENKELKNNSDEKNIKKSKIKEKNENEPKKIKKKKKSNTENSIEENKEKENEKKERNKSDDSKGKKKKKNKKNDNNTTQINKKSKDKSKNNKKGKEEKIEIGDPKEYVLNYMINQNRPYSLINIFDNLHGNIKKGQLQKILDLLTEEKKLIMKEYNTKIYLANQDNFPFVSDEELNKLDEEINLIKEENKKLKDDFNIKSNELKAISSTYTDEELDFKLKELKKEIIEKEKKVNLIQSNSIEIIPIEKMNEAEKNYFNSKKNYKKIKKICTGIIEQISEGLEMKIPKLMEDIGIENDNELLKQYNIDPKEDI